MAPQTADPHPVHYENLSNFFFWDEKTKDLTYTRSSKSHFHPSTYVSQKDIFCYSKPKGTIEEHTDWLVASVCLQKETIFSTILRHSSASKKITRPTDTGPGTRQPVTRDETRMGPSSHSLMPPTSSPTGMDAPRSPVGATPNGGGWWLSVNFHCVHNTSSLTAHGAGQSVRGYMRALSISLEMREWTVL